MQQNIEYIVCPKYVTLLISCTDVPYVLTGVGNSNWVI